MSARVGFARFVMGSVAALLIACTAAPSTNGGTPAPAASGTIVVPAGSPTPDVLYAAEAELRRTQREQAGLAKLGAGAVAFAAQLDRAATFLLMQAPAKAAAVPFAGGRLASRAIGFPPPGAPIIGTYAMTTVVFQGLVSDQPGHITDSNADNSSPSTKSANLDPTTDEVEVEGNKGTITTTMSMSATKYLSRISVEIKMAQEGEVRDAKTGAVLYKISSGAIGNASGDFCPDANGVATATFSFTGREQHFDSKGTKTGQTDTDFGGQIRFKVNDDAKLTSAEVTPTGESLGGAMMAPIAQGTAGPYEKGWRSGVCVEVIVDPNGGEVDPGSITNVTVKLRQRTEGKDLDKLVEAKMTSGVKSIEPSGQKQKAPATFKYTAGTQNGDKGGVSFDSTSNRGIGHTGVTFTVGSVWVVNGTGTSNESFQGNIATGALKVTIKDLKLAAAKDGALTGQGTMTISGQVTSGQGICKGNLDQTLPITARGAVAGTGADTVLRVTLVTASPSGQTVVYTCTVPGLGVSTQQALPAEGFADRYGEALGEFELPVEDGKKKDVSRTTAIGGSAMNVSATGSFTVTRPK